MTDGAIVPGLHERLVTTGLQRELADNADLEAAFAAIDSADQPHVLARHVYELARRALESSSDRAGAISARE